MSKSLNTLRNKAHKNAKDKGFHDKESSFAEKIMLVVTELSEAVEADRCEKWKTNEASHVMYLQNFDDLTDETYEAHFSGTVEEEIADALIWLFDIAGEYHIDLDWHVAAKMRYNKSRPRLHGKQY